MSGEDDDNLRLLKHAVTKANDVVIAASMVIMNTASTPAQQDRGRYCQELFAGVRDVLQDAITGRDPSRSPAVLALARGMVGVDDLEDVRS